MVLLTSKRAFAALLSVSTIVSLFSSRISSTILLMSILAPKLPAGIVNVPSARL